MFKKVSTLLLVAVFAVSAMSFAAVKGEKKKVIAPESVVMQDAVIPGNALAKNAPTYSKATAGPAEGVVIGTTDYDYGWNNGWSRQIQTYQNGDFVHFTFMERDLAPAAPANRRAHKYVFYKKSDGSMVSGYPRPKSVGASGFGGLDVITGGGGENIAVMNYHTPNRFAIDGGPGLAQFTESTPALNPSDVNDPEITYDKTRNALWYYHSHARLDFGIAKSTDFGASWTGKDSLLRYAPAAYRKQGTNNGTLDHPIVVGPTGDLFLLVNLTGTGALAPAGSAHADSADNIGYFKSTDGGTSWTYTIMGKDGDKLVVGTDTVYVLFENFGQFTATVDKNNKLHVVTNGYSIKVVNDTTALTYFYTLYKNSSMSSWKVISNPAAAHIADFDGDYNYGTTNGLGWCYPTIAVDTNGGAVYAAWSQYRVTGGKLDTAVGNYAQYNLYQAISHNGGTTWESASLVPNTNGAIFSGAAPFLSHSGNSRTAHLFYLADTVSGTVTAATAVGAGVVQVKWIYRTVTFTTTGVGDVAGAPSSFELSQNYPNPFNPTTSIRYALGAESNVSLKVFNMLGQEVATLVNQNQPVGSYKVAFDASKLASGMYLYKLQAGNFSEVKKMMLVK